MTPREEQRNSRVVWFEIPARDLERTVRFYENVLEVKLIRSPMGDEQMAVFPYTPPAISGGIVQREYLPPGSGPLVYLNADPSLDAALARAEAEGAKVLEPKTALPPGMGYYARILDCEGNNIGLHSVA